MTCSRCRRISSLPTKAERDTGRGYICRYCGTALFPVTPRRDTADRIESARAARLRAERLILRMPDVTPVRLAKPTSATVAVLHVAPPALQPGLQARIGAIAAMIFAGSTRRSSLRGS